MNIKPEVSIIIVSKDRSEYLSDALDSLMLQREHIKEILIFDKSMDKVHAAAIRELALRHQAILWKREPNTSTSLLRNEGIELSTGDYVSFLDDDDILLPHCIPSQWASLQSDAALVFCNYLTVLHPEHPIRLAEVLKKYVYLITLRRWTAKLAFRRGPLAITNNAFGFIATFIPIIHGAMFKKECLQKIRFSEKMVFCEDMHFWTSFYKNNIKMVFNPQVLAIYRIHDHNLSSNFTSSHNFTYYQEVFKEGFIKGRVNSFFLAIKLLRFSRWGTTMPYSDRRTLYSRILKSFYLFPLIVLVLPYFGILRFQNLLAKRKKPV